MRLDFLFDDVYNCLDAETEYGIFTIYYDFTVKFLPFNKEKLPDYTRQIEIGTYKSIYEALDIANDYYRHMHQSGPEQICQYCHLRTAPLNYHEGYQECQKAMREFVSKIRVIFPYATHKDTCKPESRTFTSCDCGFATYEPLITEFLRNNQLYPLKKVMPEELKKQILDFLIFS